jgi:hypothetical protein
VAEDPLDDPRVLDQCDNHKRPPARAFEHDQAEGPPHHELRGGRVHRPDQRDIARGGMMLAVLMGAAGVLPALRVARTPIMSRRLETPKVRMASKEFWRKRDSERVSPTSLRASS